MITKEEISNIIARAEIDNKVLLAEDYEKFEIYKRTFDDAAQRILDQIEGNKARLARQQDSIETGSIVSPGARSRIVHLLRADERFTVCEEKIRSAILPGSHLLFRRTMNGEMAVYPNHGTPQGSRLCTECFTDEFIAKHSECCTPYDPNADEEEQRGIIQFTLESLTAANVTRKIDDGERLTDGDIGDLNYAGALVQVRGTPQTGADEPNPDEPHEYVGMDVDVGVGTIFEPCHVCGDDNPKAKQHQPSNADEPCVTCGDTSDKHFCRRCNKRHRSLHWIAKTESVSVPIGKPHDPIGYAAHTRTGWYCVKNDSN